MNNVTHSIQLALVGIGLCLLAMLWLIIGIGLFEHARSQPPNTSAVIIERYDWRPDIRHCMSPDVDTWDCIRNNPKPPQGSRMKREDI